MYLLLVKMVGLGMVYVNMLVTVRMVKVIGKDDTRVMSNVRLVNGVVRGSGPEQYRHVRHPLSIGD